MGSFDMTCAVSGLPIGCGDEVRVLLLTQNPYNRGKSAGKHTCMSTDLWFPRTFPLKGKYDDYGNVKLVTEGAQVESWVKCLNLDLVEKGWGDNSVHDTAVRKKGLTIDRIEEAVSEGRLHVRQARDIDFFAVTRLISPEAVKAIEEKLGPRTRIDDLYPKQKLHPGVPTRRRIEALLIGAGFKLHDDAGYGGGGILVNRVDAMTVRVRIGAYGNDTSELEKAKALIEKKFAVMLTIGTGTYTNSAELLIRPYPQEDRHNKDASVPLVGTKPGGEAKYARRPACLAVSRAIIREDVWQAMVKDKVWTCYDGSMSFEDYRKLTVAGREKARKLPKDRIEILEARIDRDELGQHFREIPFCVGLETHWKYVVQAMEHKNASKDEVDDFIQTAAEMAYINQYLLFQRYQWRPSSSAGPQHGEWGPHASFYAAISKIATREYEEQRAQWEKDQAEYAKYAKKTKAKK